MVLSTALVLHTETTTENRIPLEALLAVKCHASQRALNFANNRHGQNNEFENAGCPISAKQSLEGHMLYVCGFYRHRAHAKESGSVVQGRG
jgi:hypothetical protein